MGEARRRSDQGLSPRQSKNHNDSSPRVIPWLPFTEKQREQFFQLTIRGGWFGIGALVLIWLVVRFLGPAAGWWTPADFNR